jgi:hypothetical protein
LVIITSVLGLGVIAVILAVFALLAPEDKTYLPGGDVEGLTSDLARDLPDDYPRVTFSDASTDAGIGFRHFQGTRSIQLAEDMGSGAAWGDYDRDGWIDLFVVNFSGPVNEEGIPSPSSTATSTLYHNNGDGTFTDVSVTSGLALRCWGMSAAWGDYDNDRFPDLLVTAYGENSIFHNNGDGTFTDVSKAAGLSDTRGFWAGGQWGDYDRDGDLDIYICGYVKYSYAPGGSSSMQYDVEVPASINPSSFPPERNLLYRNNGNGSFAEVAAAAGVLGEQGRSLGASWADLDADGWPDLYVANDVSDNVLYHNLGDGTFEEISHNALVADYRGAMGIAVGDWDRDADYDMFITHWVAQENALYSSLITQLTSGDNPLRELRFMDEADRFGLGQIALDFIGWGTSFFDYDNDGLADLFVVNGSTFQQNENPQLLVPMKDQLFWNKGKPDGFFDVSPVSGEVFREKHVGRGAAFGDYDRDGDVDVFVVNHNGPAQLLRNDGGTSNNWLEVRLEGTRSNTDGIGAHVRLVTGSIRQHQQAGVQSSYCSQNSPFLHFGLGTAAIADSLVVRWPSGAIQHFTAIPAARRITVVEGQTALKHE